MRRIKMLDIIALILATVMLGSFGQVFMKKGLIDSGGIELRELLTTKLFSIAFQKYVFAGLVLYSITTLLWFVILSKAELSFVYPLIALGYVATAFLAKIYFNENITTMRWIGIIVIILGAVLIMRS